LHEIVTTDGHGFLRGRGEIKIKRGKDYDYDYGGLFGSQAPFHTKSAGKPAHFKRFAREADSWRSSGLA
jgi:hypothetical protein